MIGTRSRRSATASPPSLLEQVKNLLVKGKEEKLLDVIEFCERELGITLFPRQRLVLKVFYGLKLTPEEEMDWASLLDGGNIYARAWETGPPYNYLVIIGGRRGSKTVISDIIQSYQVYKLLNSDPQYDYGLLPDQRISFINVAASEPQADVFFKGFRSMAGRSPIISENIIKDLEGSVTFQKNLKAERLHSNSRTIQGRTTYVATFDELAQFIDTSGPNSDEKVYQALEPSVKTFGIDGMTLIITSPRDSVGVTYEKYEQIAQGKLKNALCFQLATWEMNPNFTREGLSGEEAADPEFFEMEWGAQFAEGIGRFLPFMAVEKCFDSTRRVYELDEIAEMRKGYTEEQWRVLRGRTYYAHCDPGLRSDRFTFAVVHADAKGDCWLDYAFVKEAPKGGEIDFDLAEQHIKEVFKLFKFRLTADQWNSALLLQRLKKHGIRAKEFTFTSKSKMQMYTTLKRMVMNAKLHLPEFPLARAEMNALQRKVTPQGFSVEAPDSGPVRTDDVVDTIAAASYKAVERIGEGNMEFLKI